METELHKKWKIQADPKNKDKHPLHENRYITTEDFDFENPRLDGSIICSMRDLEQQKQIAEHIVRLHNASLHFVRGWAHFCDCINFADSPLDAKAIQWMNEVPGTISAY